MFWMVYNIPVYDRLILSLLRHLNTCTMGYTIILWHLKKKFWIRTCLLDPFPYSITETALCMRPSFGWRSFTSWDAKQEMKGLDIAGFFTKRWSNCIRVGTFLWSSKVIVSQLKCLIPSTVSLKMESCSSDASCLISAFILAATSCKTWFEMLDDFTTLLDNDLYDRRVYCLMPAFREGVML